MGREETVHWAAENNKKGWDGGGKGHGEGQALKKHQKPRLCLVCFPPAELTRQPKQGK